MDSAAAVCAELEAEEAGLLDSLEHDGTGPVAKQHEGRPVGPVEDPREDVAPHDKCSLGGPGSEHSVGLGERIKEPRAAGEEVVSRRVISAESVREQGA